MQGRFWIIRFFGSLEGAFFFDHNFFSHTTSHLAMLKLWYLEVLSHMFWGMKSEERAIL